MPSRPGRTDRARAPDRREGWSAGAASASLFAASTSSRAGRHRLAPRRQRPGQDDPAAHARRPVGAGSGPARLGASAQPVAPGALPRPRQRPEGRADRRRVAALPAPARRRHDRRRDARRRARALRHGQPARRPVRTLSQGQRRRVALARLALPGAALPGCSTSRSTPSMPTASRSLERPARRARRRGGGSVVLTSHLPLPIAEPRAGRRLVDLDRAAVRRASSMSGPFAAIVAPRPAPGRAPARRRAAADRLLHRRGQPVSARRRPRAADAAADRARRGLGRRAAGGDAVGDPALCRRPSPTARSSRCCSSRPRRARQARPGAGQGGGALARHRPAAGDRRAAVRPAVRHARRGDRVAARPDARCSARRC